MSEQIVGRKRIYDALRSNPCDDALVAAMNGELIAACVGRKPLSGYAEQAAYEYGRAILGEVERINGEYGFRCVDEPTSEFDETCFLYLSDEHGYVVLSIDVMLLAPDLFEFDELVELLESDDFHAHAEFVADMPAQPDRLEPDGEMVAV